MGHFFLVALVGAAAAVGTAIAFNQLAPLDMRARREIGGATVIAVGAIAAGMSPDRDLPSPKNRQ